MHLYRYTGTFILSESLFKGKNQVNGEVLQNVDSGLTYLTPNQDIEATVSERTQVWFGKFD